MDGVKLDERETYSGGTLTDQFDRIPQLVNIKDVHQMIDVQVATLDRLDCTNKSLANCSAMAQSKLATTTRLYKRTAKQISDSKRDLDVIYKKILDLKAKIRLDRPELFKKNETRRTRDDQVDTEANEQKPDSNNEEKG